MLAAIFKMGYRVHCATKCQSEHSSKEKSEPDSSNEIRLILIGKTGNGKSETGNTLLGKKIFESSAVASSVTKKCKFGSSDRFGRTIVVVDTPGFKDTELAKAFESYNELELLKCTGMVSPGPHAFLFVMKIGQRFGKEDEDVIEEFRDFFGPKITDHTIVLFTGGDLFDDDPFIKDLDQYITSLPKETQDTLTNWRNRSIAFNNKGDNNIKEKQVKELLGLVDEMAKVNNCPYFTTRLFEAAEHALQRKETKVREKIWKQKTERSEQNSREESRKKIEETDSNILITLAKAIIPHVALAVGKALNGVIKYLIEK